MVHVIPLVFPVAVQNWCNGLLNTWRSSALDSVLLVSETHWFIYLHEYYHSYKMQRSWTFRWIQLWIENKSCKTWNTYNILHWFFIKKYLNLTTVVGQNLTWLWRRVREFWLEFIYIFSALYYFELRLVFYYCIRRQFGAILSQRFSWTKLLVDSKMQKQPPPAISSSQLSLQPSGWWGAHMVAVSTKSISSSMLSRTTSTLKNGPLSICDCQAVILRVLISRVDLGKRAHGNLTYCGGGWWGVGGASDISRSFLVSCLSHRDRFPSVVCQQRSHSNRFTFCPPSLKQWRSQQRRSVHSPTVCRAWVSSSVTRSKLGQRSALAIYF